MRLELHLDQTVTLNAPHAQSVEIRNMNHRFAALLPIKFPGDCADCNARAVYRVRWLTGGFDFYWCGKCNIGE